tara:strand:+ start:97 stop:408 length:312 start_codon:yes stop_codon:yes gene_type:complete
MNKITKNRFKTNKQGNYRIELGLDKPNKDVPINYVFLLNQKKSSEYIKKIFPSQIPKISSFEHNLGIYLLMNYKGTPNFSVPVFEVGTKDFKYNVRNIERILS